MELMGISVGIVLIFGIICIIVVMGVSFFVLWLLERKRWREK